MVWKPVQIFYHGIKKDINEVKKAFSSSEKIKSGTEKEKIKEEVELIKKDISNNVEEDKLLEDEVSLIGNSYSMLIYSLDLLTEANNPTKNKFIAVLEKNKCIISQDFVVAFNNIVSIKNAMVGIKTNFEKIKNTYQKELDTISILYHSFDIKNIINSYTTLNTLKEMGIDNVDLIQVINLLNLISKSKISNDVINTLTEIISWPDLTKEINSIVISHDFTSEQLTILEKITAIKKGVDNNSDTLKNIYLEWENKNGDKKSCKLLIGDKAYVVNDVKNADNLKNGSRVIKMNPLKPKENGKLELFFEDSTSYIIDKVLVVKYFDKDAEENQDNTKGNNTQNQYSTEDLKKSQEKYNAAMLRLSAKNIKFDNWQEVYNKLKAAYTKRKDIVTDIIAKLPNKAELAKKDMMAYKAATNQLTNADWIENSYGVNRILNLLNYKEEMYQIISKMIKEKMDFTFEEKEYTEFETKKNNLNKLIDLMPKILPEDIKDYILPYEKWLTNYTKFNEELKNILIYAKTIISKIPLDNLKKDKDFHEDLYKIIIDNVGDVFEKIEALKWFYFSFINMKKKEKEKKKNETVNIIVKNTGFLNWLLENKEK